MQGRKRRTKSLRVLDLHAGSFSMSTQRGLDSYDAFWTVRDLEEFEGICLRACKENVKPPYSKFKKEFCSKVKKPRL